MKIEKKSMEHFENYNLKSPQTIIGGLHCEFIHPDVIACDNGVFVLFDEDEDGNVISYHYHSDTGEVHS